MFCEVCDNPIHRGKRCPRCRKIHDALSADSRSEVNAITAAMRQAYRDDSFYCSYSGVRLDTDDSSSPFYRSIDHRTPGERSDLVLCCLFINEMKGDLDEQEFQKAILALADSFRGRKPADFGDIPFKHRRRDWTRRRKGV